METTTQPDFPPVFVEYAREKVKTDRVLIEYLARFGDRTEKSEAQLVLDAAEEKLQESP